MLALHFLYFLQVIGEHGEAGCALAHLALQSIALNGKHPPLSFGRSVKFFGLAQVENEGEQKEQRSKRHANARYGEAVINLHLCCLHARGGCGNHVKCCVPRRVHVVATEIGAQHLHPAFVVATQITNLDGHFDLRQLP